MRPAAELFPGFAVVAHDERGTVIHVTPAPQSLGTPVCRAEPPLGPTHTHRRTARIMMYTLARIAAAWIVVAVSFGVIANRAVASERKEK